MRYHNYFVTTEVQQFSVNATINSNLRVRHAALKWFRHSIDGSESSEAFCVPLEQAQTRSRSSSPKQAYDSSHSARNPSPSGGSLRTQLPMLCLAVSMDWLQGPLQLSFMIPKEWRCFLKLPCS